MALTSKTIQIKIKSDGDVFHQLWKENPHEVPSLSPTTVQNCQAHEGEIGTVGCILSWNYFHDGKDCAGKSQTLEINEDKKSVTFKILEGDLMELYKTLIVHIHVDTHGSDNLVTWTVEYEKLNPNIPDPDTLLELYAKITKDVEAHHLVN